MCIFLLLTSNLCDKNPNIPLILLFFEFINWMIMWYINKDMIKVIL